MNPWYRFLILFLGGIAFILAGIMSLLPRYKSRHPYIIMSVISDIIMICIGIILMIYACFQYFD
jgi:uncharacterized membrane protein HdeD (DUF308 family)